MNDMGSETMYFKLNNCEYNITSCSVSFDLVPENQTLRMFIDVDASTDNEDVEYELQNIRLYHNNGFCIGIKDVKKMKGKKFEWLKNVNKKGEEAGTMYVLGHEDISSGTIEILDVTEEMIKIRWVGLANIFWDDEFGENVPFETEIEAKIPEIPKEKVLNGFKKTKLKIDKVTELEILNFPDILEEEERCCALWKQNDRKAWEKFNAILNLKLTYNGEEYLGRAIYAGSTRICKVEFDDDCPLLVEFTKTTIDAYNESYNFYVMVKKK